MLKDGHIHIQSWGSGRQRVKKVSLKKECSPIDICIMTLGSIIMHAITKTRTTMLLTGGF